LTRTAALPRGVIRPIAPEDLPRLRTMLQALADHDGGTGPVATIAALHQAAFGPRPMIHALIADQGMVIYYPDFSTHRGEPGVYIQDLYVTPQARGRGLARALLSAALGRQDWGARYVTLGVSPDNAAAQGFYAKLGFTRRGYEALILTETEILTKPQIGTETLP